MNEWQQRVSDERDQLAGRHVRLCNFIESAVFDGLSDEETALLARQRDQMADYYRTLTDRIALFSTGEEF